MAACSSSSPVTRCARRSRRSVRRRPPRRPCRPRPRRSPSDLTVADPGRLPKRIVHDQVEIEPGLPVPSTSVSTGARARVHQGRRSDRAPLEDHAGRRSSVRTAARCSRSTGGSSTDSASQSTGIASTINTARRSRGPGELRQQPQLRASLLAVGNGKVVEAVDGIPDQPGAFRPSAPRSPMATSSSSRLAHDVFAGYAHMIGASGSTSATACARATCSASSKLGNSNGPHLHFQLANEPSLLASTGLPLEFRNFRLTGVIPSGRLRRSVRHSDPGPVRDRGRRRLPQPHPGRHRHHRAP